MNTYVQFKDGVAFAYVSTDGEIDSLTKLDDSINPDSVMNKTLNNGVWVAAPKIRYVSQLNKQQNRILAVAETVFQSDVDGEVIPFDVTHMCVKYGDAWVEEEYMKQQTNPNGEVSWVWDSVNLVWVQPNTDDEAAALLG